MYYKSDTNDIQRIVELFLNTIINPGIDSLIEGGIPKGSTVMIAGKSGSGKTILSSQFVYYGLTYTNENGLYISFSVFKLRRQSS